MEFTETALNGAFIVKIRKIEDRRGFFGRAWCEHEFAAQGLIARMVQVNVGYSKVKGTLRGMHFQTAPKAEAKLIRCTRGALFDVLVDLRPDSPTFGKWVGVELTADDGLMLYAPEGFAHGYQTLVDGTDMYYMTSAFYTAGAVAGVRYNDPAFGIQWPLPPGPMSEADQRWPDYRSANAGPDSILPR